MRTTTLATVFSVAGIAFANGPSGWPKIEGCVINTTTAVNGNFHFMWVPETGEICDTPQCGGDRAAPNRAQPGCPFYTGTDELVYTPRYIGGTPWTTGPPVAEATPTTTEQAVEESPAVTTPATTPTEAPAEEDESTKAAEPVITSAPVISSSETEDAGFTIQTKTSVTNSGAAESSVTSASASSSGFETSTSSVKLNETTSAANNATATGGAPAQTSDETDMAAGTWPSAMTALMGAMAVLAAMAI